MCLRCYGRFVCRIQWTRVSDTTNTPYYVSHTLITCIRSYQGRAPQMQQINIDYFVLG
ncbi:hypothetical protein Bpfe_027669, partial [Biomphalaria pfeifferi]